MKNVHEIKSMRTHYTEEVSQEMDGKTVIVAGWVHELRDMGKLKFILLRDRTGIIQITAKKGIVPDEVFDVHLVKETVIRVEGKVRKEKQAPEGREIVPEKIEILGEVSTKIPFEVTGKVPADLDVRLDKRYVDLRRKETSAIFKIQNEVNSAFREKLLSLGFQEIVPPCIVAAATEGGTNLFPIIYFEKEAFLGQSPQLYKQMAVVGGMDRVFMTVPAFRAEKHNTVTHLNEVLQMDIEMGFADHNNVMDVLAKVLIHILKRVDENSKKELEVLGQKLVVPKEVKKYDYTWIIEQLKKNGVDIEWGQDFGREEEREIAKIIPDEAYFITDWPTKIRAFYSMPNSKKPEICNAFDLIYRGLEISSGAQRIHLPELLVQQLKNRGLNPDDFEFYINAFRCGAPPHGGWSIGMERITMKITGQTNIRECSMFPRDRTRLTP